jgi:hypothetical protein
LTTEDFALHAEMAGYWTRFVATGNPNRGEYSAASWPPFKRPDGSGRGNDKYIVFKSAIGQEPRLPEPQCDFFEQTFFRSLLGGLPAGRSVRCFKPVAGAQGLTLVESLTR